MNWNRRTKQPIAPRQLGRAAALSLISIVLAGAAVRDSVDHIRGAQVPQWVGAITRPSSSVVTQQFDLAIARAGTGKLPTGPGWDERARAGLKVDPLGPGAIRVLALSARSRNDEAAAGKLFALSSRLSRRDPIVQLYQIETAGKRGDIAGMLVHYDQLLSVRPQAGQILFPRLARAAEDPQVRKLLAVYIRGAKPWSADFLATANEARDPASIAEFYAVVDGARAPSPHILPFEVGLTTKLVTAGRYREAYRHVSRIAGGNGAVLGDLSFTAVTFRRDLIPFVWTADSDNGIAAGPEGHGAARIELSPGTSGVALTRVMLPQPGQYVLTSKVEPISGFTLPTARWDVVCLGAPNITLAALSFPANGSAQAGAIRLKVPVQCAAVRLSLSTTAGERQDTSALKVSTVSLSPVVPSAK